VWKVQPGDDHQLLQPEMKKKKLHYLKIAGILAAAAFIFIMICFFRQGFQTSSSGYRIKIKAESPAPAYK
jgi:hypothetical protein